MTVNTTEMEESCLKNMPVYTAALGLTFRHVVSFRGQGDVRGWVSLVYN